MIFKTVLTTLFLTLCLGMDAQANESPKQASIFELQPFERAVCCIKYYEGIHRKKDYPYVGYGHKLRAGEHYSSNMSLREADALLRKDLTELCTMFQQYGKDSLLLAALAYNVGPYRMPDHSVRPDGPENPGRRGQRRAARNCASNFKARFSGGERGRPEARREERV